MTVYNPLAQKFDPSQYHLQQPSQIVHHPHPYLSRFFFQTLEGGRQLDFSRDSSNVDDSMVAFDIGHYPNLDRIRLSHTPITLLSINVICMNQTVVRELYLDGCFGISDFDIQLIASSCKDLQVLSLIGCKQLTQGGFQSLSKLPHLQNLDLSYTHVETESIQQIVTVCRNITVLNIESCPVLDSAMLTIATSAKNLLSLNIKYCRLLTVLSIQYLTHASKRFEINCGGIPAFWILYITKEESNLGYAMPESPLCTSLISKESMFCEVVFPSNEEWMNSNSPKRDVEVGVVTNETGPKLQSLTEGSLTLRNLFSSKQPPFLNPGNDPSASSTGITLDFNWKKGS